MCSLYGLVDVPKFSKLAVRLGTLKPGDRFIDVFMAKPNPVIKCVLAHIRDNTNYRTYGSCLVKTMSSSYPVFPEITNNEDTTTMNQQDTSIYYLIHDRTNGGLTSVRHADCQAAMAEARRLALDNPGSEFVIMKARHSVTVKLPAPTITALG